MAKEFIKIWHQDIKIAEEFFDNENQLKEFIYAVIKYYLNENFQIKTKIVKKYFETYKKTMDYVISSKEYGKKAHLQKLDNKDIKDDTLQGVVQGVLVGVLPPKVKEKEKENIKINKSKKVKDISYPTYPEFLNFCIENDFEHIAKKAFDYYSKSDWIDGNGKRVLDWKRKIRTIWFDSTKNPKPTKNNEIKLNIPKKVLDYD